MMQKVPPFLNKSSKKRTVIPEYEEDNALIGAVNENKKLIKSEVEERKESSYSSS